MTKTTVTNRLVAFVRQWQANGLPSNVLHEANRLLINQLKASVGAMDHPAVRILRQWAMSSAAPAGRNATFIWFGDQAAPEQAAVVNGALFEVLDFNETYIPTFQHAVSGVLPAVLAEAEALGSSGRQVLEALALGIEVELAIAWILMPSAYFRGFVPGGITGAIGGATACAVLAGLDDDQLRNAMGLAMNAAAGTYQSAGSMALPYIMGMTARSGLTAAHLAAMGMDAPAAAFEGDKGMHLSYSGEPVDKVDGVMAELGKTWRIHGQSYKTIPTETITHGPVECVMEILKRAGGRRPAQMRFKVAPIVVDIANERGERFGVPANDLEAKFDLRHCAAAAWVRGRFTLAEMREAAFTDPAILDLRSRTELLPDETQKTFDGAGLEVVFEDGTTEQVFIPNFLGTPGNPMSDNQLSDVFRLSAEDVLPPGRADAILKAAWSLDGAADIREFMALLTTH